MEENNINVVCRHGLKQTEGHRLVNIETKTPTANIDMKLRVFYYFYF